MQLKEIYRPIEKELDDVEQRLKGCLENTRYKSTLEMSNYLFDAGGKRLRPALVLLSAKAIQRRVASNCQLNDIATAVELIHIASLVHDDVIDHSCLRHNKPTINSKWGQDVSIALGGYLYSVAFELISQCGNTDILHCISSATKVMCEGELLQVCERDNINLLKENYIVIVRKKTANLFAASCQVGALVSNCQEFLRSALIEYGLNFGIAFQIIDDYLDLVGEEKRLGKTPGQDIGVGEITLPLLNLLESVPVDEREELKLLLFSKGNKQSLKKIKLKFFNSGATYKTKISASSYMTLAKKNLNGLSDSPFKRSLIKLTDYMLDGNFNGKGVRE